MTVSWQAPAGYANRPVAILSAELVYDSHFYASATYVEENVALYAKKTGIAPSKTEAFEDMKSAVGNT
ncbi:hypothetical protein HAV15_011170 [Penicillium sp. str. |nr:hypothetical protein HAV15_011170 [Penicillium sp. str. \